MMAAERRAGGAEMSWPKIVKEIAEVCREHPTNRKLLLVENYQAGQLILQTVAKCAGGWLNLIAVTPLDLAWSAIEADASAKGLKAADELSLECFVLNSYNKIRRSFFPDSPPLGLISAIARTIAELRIAGVAPAELRRIRNIYKAKAADLAALMKELEAELTRSSLLDEAEIYEMARGKSEGTLHLIRHLLKSRSRREFVEPRNTTCITINDDLFGNGTLIMFRRSTAEPETSFLYLWL